VRGRKGAVGQKPDRAHVRFRTIFERGLNIQYRFLTAAPRRLAADGGFSCSYGLARV
jgi:hypothetical protein